MDEDKKKLEALRQEIDQIDVNLQELLSERARCAQAVAIVKQSSVAEFQDALFYRPEREAQVLRAVKARNKGPLTDEAMTYIFRQIMSVCLSIERSMQVAFLGPEGTFTHMAVLKHFGHAVRISPMNNIDEVFREVEADSAHYGVVPVENSTEGVVNRTLDSFMRSPLLICGEVELRVHHHLLLNGDAQLSAIKRIYAHQQALAQCRQWLIANCPHADQIAVSSNGEAAKRVKKEKNAAAIAGDMAAEIYKLDKLVLNIEDSPYNSTRFIIVGKQKTNPSKQDKTSILVLTRNTIGALYKVLEPFYNQGVGLTSIETRPSRLSNWAYVFFIDFEGHYESEKIKSVLKEVKEHALEIKWLGSYPAAIV